MYRVDWDFALVAYRPTVNAVIIQRGVSFTLMYEPRGFDEMHRSRNKLDEIPLEQRECSQSYVLAGSQFGKPTHVDPAQLVSLKTSRT